MALDLPFLLADRYELTAEIGRGGHAIVYQARDRVDERDVAVKFLREEIASPSVLARFRQEVQVTLRLDHAHILRTFDSGDHEGRPFVIMELASGTTLAGRLEREGQLPIAEACGIVRQVGEALAYAHAQGIIHRDVKPENVLFGSSGALLADFGIARVTVDEDVQRITSTGITVGTLQYMSPEQLCADPNIDGRSDQYSLACVLYEMLAGVRPHIAATFEGLRMLRSSGTHIPVQSHRPSVPGGVDHVLRVALASMPADRYPDMAQFLSALHEAISNGSRGTTGARVSADAVTGTGRKRWLFVAGGAIAASALALSLSNRNSTQSESSAGQVTVVSVAKPARTANDSTSVDARVRNALRSEVRAWKGVLLAERYASSDRSSLQLQTSVSLIGDSANVRLDIRSGAVAGGFVDTLVGRSALQQPASLVSALTRRAFVRFLDTSLTIAETPGADRLPDRSLPALRDYTQGFAALRHGLLDSASVHFRNAATASPQFAQAQFWAAQSIAWRSPSDVSTWKTLVEGAVRNGRLAPVDSLLALALEAISQSEFPNACVLYRQAGERDPDSFVAWYGLGECQRLDSLVLTQPAGISRFRSSHWQALSAYRRAIAHAPTAEWMSTLFEPVMRLTYPYGSWVRPGRTLESPEAAYFALPSLDHDTLTFIPVPKAQFQNMDARAVPVSWAAAIARGRRAALDVTYQLVTRFPQSSDAWFHRSVALELAGQIDTAQNEGTANGALAMALTRTPSTQLLVRAGVARTRLALRRGDISGAARTARDVLRSMKTSTGVEAAIAAPLAAFTGDAATTTRLLLASQERNVSIPEALERSLTEFSVDALVGSCDGLDGRQRQLEKQFESMVAPADSAARRAQLLKPVLRSAVPCVGTNALTGFTPDFPLDSAFAAISAGKPDVARAQLRKLQERRIGATVGALTWDYLFAESWALAAAGDTAAARKQLTDALDDVASMSMFTLQEVPQAAGLRRGMQLLKALCNGPTACPSARRWIRQLDTLLTLPPAGTPQ